ncbi:MAG: hypothetical protein V1774_03685, partial [Candidatus Eisenbacteria bacterium]
LRATLDCPHEEREFGSMADLIPGGVRPEREEFRHSRIGPGAVFCCLGGKGFLRGGPHSRLRLLLLIAVLLQPCGAGAGQSISSGETWHWAFEPLGPEGASVAEVHALGSSRWAVRTTDGEVFLRDERNGESGAWDLLEVPVIAASSRLTATRISPWNGDLVILTSEGLLLLYSLGDPDREAGPGTIAGATQPAGSLRRGWRDAERARDGFRLLGAVPIEAARATVAVLVPPENVQAGGREQRSDAPDAPGVLLFTRDGQAFEVSRRETRPVALGLTSSVAPSRSPTEPAPEQTMLRSAWRLGAQGRALLVLTEWEGLFVSWDAGRTFQPVSGGLPKEVRALGIGPRGAAGLFAGTADGFFASMDLGVSWTPLGHSMPIEGGESPEPAWICCPDTPERPLLVITQSGKLFRSGDGGTSWQRLLTDLPARVNGVAAERAEVRVATSRGVLASDDGGRSWVPWDCGLRRVSVQAISVATEEEGSILLATDLGAYSMDASAPESWMPVGSRADSVFASQETAREGDEDLLKGPEGLRVIEVARAPLELDWVFARTPDGVFASIDQGASWSEVPLPPGISVTSLAVDFLTRRLLLGTYRYGLFAADLPQETTLSGLVLPVHASPNPFAETVMLRCILRDAGLGEGAAAAIKSRALPFASTVPAMDSRTADAPAADGTGASAEAQMLILSVHGQLIRRLQVPVRVTDAFGERSLLWRWDGLDERGQAVPSGVYMVAAVAGDQRYCGKLIKLH